jgi:4-amino-4-deoxychorismate lyase
MQKHSQTIITSDQNTAISIKDRGLNYGDGFFTTAKIVNGQVENWHYHKARLVECAACLGFPKLDFSELELKITKSIAAYPLSVLKIIITRGEGGRGYTAPDECCVTILLSILAFPSGYDDLAIKGVKLAVSPIKLASQPILAGLKTLNRLEQVLIKNAMQTIDCDDVLVLDENDNVIEASAANIVIIKNSQIFTPSLINCGIKGVFLRSLCDKLFIIDKPLTLTDILSADAVYICNSLMEIVPVNGILEKVFNPIKSMALLNELITKEAK